MRHKGTKAFGPQVKLRGQLSCSAFNNNKKEEKKTFHWFNATLTWAGRFHFNGF